MIPLVVLNFLITDIPASLSELFLDELQGALKIKREKSFKNTAPPGWFFLHCLLQCDTGFESSIIHGKTEEAMCSKKK
jgi:hypothetical protein